MRDMHGISQGGFGILCYDKKLSKTGVAQGKLYWRSGKIHRVVNSTLAAETQSLAKGLQELAGTITVYNELCTPDFELKEWESAAKKRRLEVRSHYQGGREPYFEKVFVHGGREVPL